MTMVNRNRQRGIALMLVMWVLMLLTVMAVSLTASQRTETALTENHLTAVRFRALADAAVAYTALDFLTQSSTTESGTEAQSDAMSETTDDAETAWLPNGVPRAWRFAGSEVAIAVTNESSRIDLNQAEPDLLTSLLKVLGVPEDEAGAIAGAIVDWRDEDDMAQLNGAEDGDYKQAGRAYGAKDAPFESVEELRQVFGMTPGIYRRMIEQVTVEQTGGSVVEEFASPYVLASTQGLSLEDAVEKIQDRDSTTVPDATAARSLDRGGPLYRIQIAEQGPGAHGRRMEALLELTVGQDPPYRVRWRHYGLARKPLTSPIQEAEAQLAAEEAGD